MADFKDHFSSGSDRYQQYRPTYPLSLFKWLQARAGKKSTVWECGAGTGQATTLLAQLFQTVIATDASQEQLAQAPELANVNYVATPAETFSATAESIDLIAVAQAIHWFDHDRFFALANTVLKPGGFLAVWGYQFIKTDTAIDQLIMAFHTDLLGPFWPTERKLLNDGYKGIEFPYSALETPPFKMEAEWSFEHLIGYLNTWSAVKQYEKANGQNPIELVISDFAKAWGDPKQVKTVSWPLILYVGRKPLVV